MATVTWTGTAGDGDWTNTNNWDGDGGSGPATNDDVVINATSDDIATNMSQGSVDLGSLAVGPNFKGTIGTAGGPLTIAVSGTAGSGFTSGLFRYASGGGDSFITAGTNGIDKAEIQHVSQSTFYATGGTYLALNTSVRSGPVQISGSATVTTLNHQSRHNTHGLKAASGVTLTTVNHEGAYMESAADIGTGHITGRLKMTGTAKFGTIGYLWRGATYMKHSSGTDVAVRVGGGATFTPENSPAGNYTVTTLTETEGSTVIKDAPGVSGTFTNNPTIGAGSGG